MSSDLSEASGVPPPLPTSAPPDEIPISPKLSSVSSKPEYTLETLASNSNSSFDSSQLNLDSTEDFITSNEMNIENCGLGNRDGYTVISPIQFSTPAPSINGGSMRNSGYNLSGHTNPIINNYSPMINQSGSNVQNQNGINWQAEVDELLKMKSNLENNISELKNYLAAKKSQCNENVRNSQQIKRFINMTMNQIKRKVELELENKRDELFSSVDSFCDNQKKLSISVNEDSFQSAERVCDEIENLVLNTE